MNKCILIGRLVADPEERTTSGGTAVARYRIAVDRYKTKDGNADADFFNCVAYARNAQFALKYLRKGTKIGIEGRLWTGSYEKNGTRIYTTEVVVDHQEFCESRRAAEPEQYTDPELSDEDFAPISDDEDMPF